jgi:apolipoprotein N-acyltransferase
LLVVVLLVPILLGALASHLARPWWWAAAGSVILFVLAATLPEPEQGEPHVAAADVPFLVVVALVVIGLTWLGAFAHRRAVRNR